tara:strand:- start:117 stop:488 length:372 start_codon:yes stop_codon:yes gene_type:complete
MASVEEKFVEEKVFTATLLRGQVYLQSTESFTLDFKEGTLMEYLKWCYYCGFDEGRTTQMEAFEETLQRIANPHISRELVYAMIATIQQFDAAYAAAQYGDDEVCHADVIVTQCQEEPKRIFH